MYGLLLLLLLRSRGPAKRIFSFGSNRNKPKHWQVLVLFQYFFRKNISPPSVCFAISKAFRNEPKLQKLNELSSPYLSLPFPFPFSFPSLSLSLPFPSISCQFPFPPLPPYFGSFGSFLVEPKQQKEPKHSSLDKFRKNQNKSFCFRIVSNFFRPSFDCCFCYSETKLVLQDTLSASLRELFRYSVGSILQV